MGLFDFIQDLFQSNENQETIDIKRDEIISKMREEFTEKLHFTTMEFLQIEKIIDEHLTKINNLKMTLDRVNINNPNTEQDVENVTKQIQKLAENMNIQIKGKAAEIILEKRHKFHL